MRRRWLGALAVIVAVSGLAACSDGDSPDAPTTSAKARIDPDVVVRFPRYWATTDQAESGAESASNTRFFLGVDGNQLIYNGQDVIRTIDRSTGKQIRQTLITGNEVICAFPPDRQIDGHILVLATGRSGTAGDGECQTVRGYDLAKGRFIWSSKLKYPSSITLDTRDDSVLISRETQDPRDYQISYAMSALDLHTGRQRWATTAAKAYTDTPGKDLSDCTVRGGVAASKPVVVALADCSDFSAGDDAAAQTVGYDLGTGKRLWRTDATWAGLGDLGGAEYVFPDPNDAAYFPATRETRAGYIDLKTGRGTRVPTPDVAQYEDSEDNSYTPCDDFGSNGNLTVGACVYPMADDTLLYVNELSAKTGTTLRMEGVTKETGKRRFLVEYKPPRPKKGQSAQGAPSFLGVDDAREEFWIARNDVDVERYSVRTGKRTGRGQLAPPLGLTQIATMGPGYLAVRGAGGITDPDSDVLSGVDYYRTNTTRK